MENISPQATKKYTFTKRRGNMGAAHLEMLLSQFALVNRIDEAKDIGIDFICEYTEDNRPTGILFAVQCKTSVSRPRKPDKPTLGYWKSFSIPFYEFWLKPKKDKEETGEYIEYYKRWTPQLHSPGKRQKFEPYKEAIVNYGTVSPKQVFLINLFYDHLRCGYRQGAFPHTEQVGPSRDILNVMKEHTKELRRQGWAMPFAQGIIRAKSKTLKELVIARQSFELSLALWDPKANNDKAWKKSAQKHLEDVKKKIKKLDDRQ